jgi:hypothetical protein
LIIEYGDEYYPAYGKEEKEEYYPGMNPEYEYDEANIFQFHIITCIQSRKRCPRSMSS